MRIDIITVLPELIQGFMQESIVGRAQRKGLVEMIFGPEPFEHKENISARKYGFARVSFAMITATALFLAIYITADCAGTRPFWFMASKFGLSLAASYIVSALLVNLLSYDDRR